MASEYLGAVKLFSFGFAPKGYALCAGQIMSIQQNAALFSLLGTTFGGNGIQTFALPDLQGRVPIGQGTGVGLSNYVMGQKGGVENVTLLQSTVPSHTHVFQASTTGGNSNNPSGNVLATLTDTGDVFYAPFAGGFTAALMPPATVSTVGQTQPHTNIQPTAAINYSICLSGIFPSRS
jgi:microcystin-dependent protein